MDWVRLELTSNSLQDCRFAELSYQPESESRRRDSNPRPSVYETAALNLLSYSAESDRMSLAGVEPATCGLEDRRSSPLSYRPGRREGDGGIRTPTEPFTGRPLCQLKLHRREKRELVGARGQAAPLAPRSRGSRRSAGDEPSAPKESKQKTERRRQARRSALMLLS